MFCVRVAHDAGRGAGAGLSKPPQTGPVSQVRLPVDLPSPLSRVLLKAAGENGNTRATNQIFRVDVEDGGLVETLLNVHWPIVI